MSCRNVGYCIIVEFGRVVEDNEKEFFRNNFRWYILLFIFCGMGIVSGIDI